MDIIIYAEFQTILTKYLSTLINIEILNKKPKVSEPDRLFLEKLGIATIEDLLNANDRQVIYIYRRNMKLFVRIIEVFDIVCSLCRKEDSNQKIFNPIDAYQIMSKADGTFMNLTINYEFSPKYKNRIKNSLDKAGIYTYLDLKNNMKKNRWYHIKGLGLLSLRVLNYIIVYDYFVKTK